MKFKPSNRPTNTLAKLAKQITRLENENKALRSKRTRLPITLRVRANERMSYFIPFSSLILFNLSQGVSIASIARYLYTNGPRRYKNEATLYQALYQWVRSNCRA